MSIFRRPAKSAAVPPKPPLNTCFVCGKVFKKNAKLVYIGVKDGMNLVRHERCDCFSAAWTRKFGATYTGNNGRG